MREYPIVETSFIECWQPIANFEIKYLISNVGIVWNLGKEKEQSQYNVDGYRHVHLKLNGQYLQISVHRLVALHFLPNPYQHPIVNHIDGNKSHNKLSNLEWASSEQNVQHALEMGLRSGFMPLDTKRSLLLRVLEGELIRSLAQETGRREETLSGMLRRTAERDGLQNEWKTEMKRRRTLVAIRNLEQINSGNSSRK